MLALAHFQHIFNVSMLHYMRSSKLEVHEMNSSSFLSEANEEKDGLHKLQSISNNNNCMGIGE